VAFCRLFNLGRRDWRTTMFDEYKNQEIEASVIIMAAGYAVTLITLIVWFATQVGY